MPADPLQAPLVSVIMNCLNCEKYLREAIDSVFAQTYPCWEIIFWDNASTDHSGDIARSYGQQLRYFREPETIPLGAARNQALKQARGDFIAFLDCDDVWLPEKLARQIPRFDDPEVGIVFCDTIYFNNKGDSERLYQKRGYQTGYCFSRLLTDYFLAMPSVVIRKTALEELPEWFDPRYNVSEEADLFIRLAYKWKLAMVSEALAKWRLHSASLTWTKDHLFAEEYLDMLQKYSEIFPDFTKQFDKEIRHLRFTVAMLYANHFWRTGQSARARVHLRSYIFLNKKALVLYAMSYFPEYLIRPILNRFRSITITPGD